LTCCARGSTVTHGASAAPGRVIETWRRKRSCPARGRGEPRRRWGECKWWSSSPHWRYFSRSFPPRRGLSPVEPLVRTCPQWHLHPSPSQTRRLARTRTESRRARRRRLERPPRRHRLRRTPRPLRPPRSSRHRLHPPRGPNPRPVRRCGAPPRVDRSERSRGKLPRERGSPVRPKPVQASSRRDHAPSLATIWPCRGSAAETRTANHHRLN
jgi:hypothetical protein